MMKMMDLIFLAVKNMKALSFLSLKVSRFKNDLSQLRDPSRLSNTKTKVGCGVKSRMSSKMDTMQLRRICSYQMTNLLRK